MALVDIKGLDKDVKLSDVCDTRRNQAKKSVVDADESRVAILLRAAKELLIKQRDFGILMDFPLTVHYDDADCDGYCLIYDINAELDALGEKSQDADGQQNQAEEKLTEEPANLITLENLIKTLKRNAAAHFLSRRCGKRYVMSIYYQLNKLQAIEEENTELRKRIKELEQEEE